jgi:hypothetical protein
MKRLLIALPLLLVVGETAAIDRHDTSRMTCAQVTATLQSERKAILRYPSSRVPGLMRYDTYVPDRQACSAGQLPVMSNVPTTDTKSCRVFRCVAWQRSTLRY